MPSVLIIDDDDSLRRVMEYQLGQAGYRVLVAADGPAGLAVFREERPDLVITDVQMPTMSGYEVLRAIRELGPETVVIVVTAFATVEKAVEAMRQGAHDYLTKPFSRDALCMAVEKALAFRGLKEENSRLKSQLAARQPLAEIIGVSAPMQELARQIRQVAPSEATVLIGGESGTGKELVARAIHRASDRGQESFVPVNCAAIPKDLLESELFGHLKGAFTGAVRDRQGKFAQADGGTLFLDEVGELPLDLQPKLLRALQEREIEPVGGKPRKVDVRVVAASNRDLETAVAEGEFREDLYYRLAVIPLQIPPLRQRTADIPQLVRHLLAKHGAPDLPVSRDCLDALGRYPWPGNVRELENTLERCIVLKRGEEIVADDLPVKIRTQQPDATDPVLNLPEQGYPLDEIEKQAVLQALRRCGWNQTRAAEFLRIPRHTLLYRMEKYQLKKPS